MTIVIVIIIIIIIIVVIIIIIIIRQLVCGVRGDGSVLYNGRRRLQKDKIATYIKQQTYTSKHNIDNKQYEHKQVTTGNTNK